MKYRGVITLLVGAGCVCAAKRDVADTFAQLKMGAGLTAEAAAKLERRLEKKPGDEAARVELLAYYAAAKPDADLAAVKEARARHILWLIEHDPKEGLGLFQVASGVYRMHCESDALADAEAYARVSEAWQRQVAAHPEDKSIRSSAADAIGFCEPEAAERLLIEAKDGIALGRLYGAAVLGITGESYQNRDPAGTSAERRASAFAAKARGILEESTDKEIVGGAVGRVLQDGATLWADGKLDWDYTALGKSLLEKAKAADPDNARLLTLPTTLPKPGERPPMTLRIGGNVQAANIVRKVTPEYPKLAREVGIEGTVKMLALLGLDGTILHLQVLSGPPELVEASLGAVRQWVYKPTLLNGKPCYVITQIDVNYVMSAR